MGKAARMPVLNQIVGETLILPGTVGDECYQEVIGAGAVEVLSTDDKGRALFPATGGIKAGKIHIATL